MAAELCFVQRDQRQEFWRKRTLSLRLQVQGRQGNWGIALPNPEPNIVTSRHCTCMCSPWTWIDALMSDATLLSLLSNRQVPDICGAAESTYIPQTRGRSPPSHSMYVWLLSAAVHYAAIYVDQKTRISTWLLPLYSYSVTVHFTGRTCKAEAYMCSELYHRVIA